MKKQGFFLIAAAVALAASTVACKKKVETAAYPAPGSEPPAAIATAKKYLGVTDKELDKLCTAVVGLMLAWQVAHCAVTVTPNSASSSDASKCSRRHRTTGLPSCGWPSRSTSGTSYRP